MQQVRVKNTKWWQDHVETWQKSKLSQSDYCRLNGLNKKSFSNWKLKKDKSHVSDRSETSVLTSPSIPIQLIPVAISDPIESVAKPIEHAPKLSTPDFSGITLVVKIDYQINLATDFNPSTLKNLLALLAG